MTALPIGVTDRHRRPLTRLLPAGRAEVVWDRQVQSNALVVGGTGSGKTKLLYALGLGALRAGNQVALLDGKGRNNFAPYTGRHGVIAVEHDPMAIVTAVRDLAGIVDARYDEAAAAFDHAEATDTAPVYAQHAEITVILDEYITWLHDLTPGVRAEMVSRLMNMCMRAREAGVRIVIATQAPNAEQRDAVLPTPMRSQLGFRVLLGSGEDNARRIVLGSLIDEIPNPEDDDLKGRGVAVLLSGAWVPVQCYLAVSPNDDDLTDAQRDAARAQLPPKVPPAAPETARRRGAFGLVREVS